MLQSYINVTNLQNSRSDRQRQEEMHTERERSELKHLKKKHLKKILLSFNPFYSPVTILTQGDVLIKSFSLRQRLRLKERK